MKIAVLHRYPPRQVIGTNASFIDFLRILSERNHEVFYLTYKDKGDLPAFMNLKYVFLPFTFNRGNNLDKVIKTYLWIFLIPIVVFFKNKKEKFDVIYCDDSVPYFAFLTKVLNPKTKVVIRLGDLQSSYALADKSKKLFGFVLNIETLMWKRMDGLVAISNSFKKFLLERGLEEKKISVVEESVNLSNDVYTEGIERNKQEVVFMFHGALVKCKGTNVLLDAFSILNKKYPNTKLIIAGGGNEEKALRNQAKLLKLKNIEFIGWYDHAKLEEIVRRVDISIAMRSPNMANNFVVTTCLLENWKYKKPVIVPDLDSFKEVIKDGINGIFFKVGDSNDLFKKMEYLLNKKDVWNTLGENGFKTSKDIFDCKKIAFKMVCALEEYARQ
ncbi:glycosyltransferase family 4 protein [candidate division WWE3 bacterium]|uniref:Glycosyltransferase family 4 protein n=1 Tax=candidate division WWE3 bacterium TaxID=2053526 RepID=A0A7X9E6M3_UNCKA|nr:glycosyltransferase family 4 protein [candidate division WWE3 bacterium]